MENNFIRNIYDVAPPYVKNIAASSLGWFKNKRRRGGDFSIWFDFFQTSSSWNKWQLCDYQNKLLQKQVKHAVENVVYYQTLFKKLNLTINDIKTVNDLKKLPILEKKDIVTAGNDLISKAWPLKKINWYPTSGSTGTPLMVPRPLYIDQMECAFLYSRYFGSVIGQPYSTFTGLELIPASQCKPPFWVENWTNQQRMYSIFHMNDKTLPYYIKSLNQRYSHYYLGYPSAVYTIAKYMLDNSIVLDRPPKYFFSGSEELQPHYENTIRAAFGCEIRNHYGQNEFVGSITMRDCGHLHYDMDYSIMEFLPVGEEDGAIVAEIVATNMHDSVWPLLRYRTGDLVIYHPDDCCDKGYPSQIIKRINGRTGHFFVLPDGSRITNISVIAKKCRNIKLMQVVQRNPNSIVIKVVKDEGYTINDEKKMIYEFRKKIGAIISIEIESVNNIERSSSGKYFSIVNEISDEL